MTRKDYELIAEAIKEVAETASEHEEDAIGRLVFSLLRKLRENNPKFDTKKFEKACGLRFSIAFRTCLIKGSRRYRLAFGEYE